MGSITIKGKEYEVRELETEDIGRLSVILDKTGFDLKDFSKDIKGKRFTEDQMKQIGFTMMADMVAYLIRNYHKANKEAREFFADLIGVKPDQYAKMPITTPVKILKELAKENDLMDFFKLAAG